MSLNVKGIIVVTGRAHWQYQVAFFTPHVSDVMGVIRSWRNKMQSVNHISDDPLSSILKMNFHYWSGI